MQGLTASLIVAVAAAYAAWQVMPQSMRRRLIGRTTAIAPSRRAWLARLEANAEHGECKRCNGCAADRQVPAPHGQAKIEVHRTRGKQRAS